MGWINKIEAVGPDDLVEILDEKVFQENKPYFNSLGFTQEIFDKIKSVLRQQVWSAAALFALAKMTPKNGRAIEIGCGEGGSLVLMGLANPTLRLIGIDKFIPFDEETHAGTARGYQEATYEEFLKTVTLSGFDIRLIRAWSEEAVGEIDDGSCDLIFIDGNHSFKNVIEDIRLYKPKLKAGGILCGHDYHPRFPGVIKGVKACFIDKYDVVDNSSIWVAK